MRRFRSLALYFVAVTLGLTTMAAIVYRWLPHGLIAVAFALFFILMLPRQPRLVAAFCGGAVLAVAFAFAALLYPGWDNCADEVGGEFVEYKCSEGPPTR